MSMVLTGERRARPVTRSTVPSRMRVARLDAPRDPCVADEPGHRLPLERGGEAFAVASRAGS